MHCGLHKRLTFLARPWTSTEHDCEAARCSICWSTTEYWSGSLARSFPSPWWRNTFSARWMWGIHRVPLRIIRIIRIISTISNDVFYMVKIWRMSIKQYSRCVLMQHLDTAGIVEIHSKFLSKSIELSFWFSTVVVGFPDEMQEIIDYGHLWFLLL